MLNVKANVGLLLVLICLSKVSNISAQTVSSCKADSITIKDLVTGMVQCQDCRKCSAGEGLSVNCGDVVSPQTPLVCRPCVLGETYSSAYEAGACKDCKNCGEYRETKKACTLTSKAVCGKCKPGTYYESMLTMCQPCSPCCNDGKDIIVPECQVPGVPIDTQCSFARSDTCSKLMAKMSVSSIIPTVQTNHSKAPSTAVKSSRLSVPLTKLRNDSSTPQPGIIAGSVIGGIVIVFILPSAIIIRCCVVKRRKDRKKASSDLTHVETVIGERLARVQDNDQADSNNQKETETSGQNPAVKVLEATGTVQKGREKIQEQTGNGTHAPGQPADFPEETSVAIQESGEQRQAQTRNVTDKTNPSEALWEKKPVQESGDDKQERTTRLPGRYDFKPFSNIPDACPDQVLTSKHHSPANVAIDLRLQATVDLTSGSSLTGVVYHNGG